jgi:glutamate carboxypeptidase
MNGSQFSFSFRSILFLVIAMSMSSQLAWAQLSKTERKIAENVLQRSQEGLRFLEHVVNINSGTMNFEGVKKVGEAFQTKFDALGFQTRWIDGKAWNRAGHLVAERKGKGKTILLIGHLDTVFEPDSPFQTYTLINDSTASGPGVGDMKGGNVIMLQALQALHDSNLLKDMNIIVFLCGDEEMSGDPLSLARYDLIEAAKRADIALGFEDGDGRFESVNISRRSSTDWKLVVKGTPAHSSQIFTPTVGAGSIYEASRILMQFYEKLSTEENLTFNPGVILGGTTVTLHEENGGQAFGKGNIVAKETIVTGDIRAMSPEQLLRAQQMMQHIVNENLPQTEATLHFGEGYPALAPTEGNQTLLKLFNQVSLDLNLGPVHAVNPRDAGAADISFTSGYVPMVMDGIGMRCAGGHTVNETADPRTVALQAQRTALLLYRLTRTK